MYKRLVSYLIFTQGCSICVQFKTGPRGNGLEKTSLEVSNRNDYLSDDQSDHSLELRADVCKCKSVLAV